MTGPASSAGELSIPPDRLTRREKALETLFGKHFVQTFASPFLLLEDHVIECPVAIRFYKKDFSYLSKQLYLEYQYRAWKAYDAELLARYAELVTNKLAHIQVLMTNTAQRLQLLLDQQGHKADLMLWPAPHRCDVPIIAAHARSYIDMLRLLDRVYLLSGTANLLGVIDSSQRAQAEYACKKAVRAFRSILQSEVAKLYREAQRVIREQQGAGQADPRNVALVAQQGEVIAEFEASSAQEERSDADVAAAGVPDGQGHTDALAAEGLQPVASAPATRRRAAAKPKPEEPAATPEPLGAPALAADGSVPAAAVLA